MVKKLLQLLLERKLINNDEYRLIEQLAINKGCSEEYVVLQEFNMDFKELISLLETDFKIPYIDLQSNYIKNGAFKLISKEMASKHSLIPFFYNNEEVHIAFSNPFDIKVIDELKFITNQKIIVYFTSAEHILRAIENCYGKQVVEVAVEEMKKEYLLHGEQEKEQSEVEYTTEAAPVIRITSSLLKQGVNAGASDIHLEPFENYVIVRLRVDGILYEINQIPNNVYRALCTRIKIMSNIDIANKLIPQDGKMTQKIDGLYYDFRVSSLPTMYGEKLVIRILYKSEKFINLDSLGFNSEKVIILRDIVKLSHGMILITGPTGSGKSTTLYALLNEIDSKSKNIITIEDPIEYKMPRINQVNVNNKAGLSFSMGLRSILRQDPDVIMIGEIRDEETAQIAVRAAITGHLVFTTLHTNDALSSISRLVDMGIPPYLVADSLVVVVAQRLVRKLCPYCKMRYEISHEEFAYLGLTKGEITYKAVGCSKCNETGYKGRTVIYELIKLDNNYKSIISKKGVGDELWKYSMNKNTGSLMDSSKEAVVKGITSVEEFINSTYSYKST